MKEWREIKGYNGLYQINNLGEVKSITKFIYLKPQKNSGYLSVTLYKNKIGKIFKIHRLVANHFISNPENKPCVNHKDGNKYNNKINNLEWCTYSENELHSNKILGKRGLFKTNHPFKGKFGKECKSSKEINQYTLNGIFIKSWINGLEAQKGLGINKTNISACCNGKRKTAGGYKWDFN